MANFQRIVIVIAFVILLICLIIVGTTLAKSNSSQAWPPLAGTCPDYWLDTSGTGSKCINNKDLGTCNANVGPEGHSSMDFSVSPFIGSNATCAKYTWANKCGVSWDGITYGFDKNPCETPPATTA